MELQFDKIFKAKAHQEEEGGQSPSERPTASKRAGGGVYYSNTIYK